MSNFKVGDYFKALGGIYCIVSIEDVMVRVYNLKRPEKIFTTHQSTMSGVCEHLTKLEKAML